MPIARFEVRSEYGLGKRELYRSVDREDPKAVLDGVSVAGIVGILRQLGDLAEFAAEMFHGIQEEAMATASRSNKLMIRLQHVEATVPSLEKTMLSQTSRIHFAYTSGREWHPRIPNEQSHFICYDLPRVVMDSYEECRDPPRLHSLDKFDINGPGSCLKRYSDPTYFRRASGKPIDVNKKDGNNGKSKKKKPPQRNRDLSCLASVAKQSGRKPFVSLSFSGRTSSSSKTASTIGTEPKSDSHDHSRSFDSRSGSGYVEGLSTATSSVKAEGKPLGFSSSSFTPGALTIGSVLSECHSEEADDHFSYSPPREQAGRRSSFVGWDETMESDGLKQTTDEAPEMDQVAEAGRETERVSGAGSELETGTESEGETFVDALITIESESESDHDYYGFQTRSREAVKNPSDVSDERLGTLTCGNDSGQQETEQGSGSGEDRGLVDGLEDRSLGNDQKSCGNASEEPIYRDSGVDLENESRQAHLPAGGDVHDDCSSDRLCSNGMDEHHRAAESEAHRNDKPVTIWTNGNLLGLHPSKPPDSEKEKADMIVGNLVNGFRRKEPFVGDRKIVPATIPENAEEETFGDDSPIDWLSSSPPLEHMKISFNPDESLPISGLKLRFPDGNSYTFSSFQLVPEPATSVLDFDSDDDTFCRSSPNMSENDYPSDDDSAAERYDSKLYDSLHGSTPDVPSLQAPNPNLRIETTDGSVPENLSYLQIHAEPLPPPLPPLQWRSTERFEQKQQSLHDELKRALDKRSYPSVGSPLPRANPVKNEQPAIPKPENDVYTKNNGGEDKRSSNVTETEAGDFLHQIRTKQFNLRRVESTTTRPSAAAATGLIPNVSINAILEKASSIRQAVAYDEDESDTWSDT